jgi:hypothetical protein
MRVLRCEITFDLDNTTRPRSLGTDGGVNPPVHPTWLHMLRRTMFPPCKPNSLERAVLGHLGH